jgi:hypothetical protein
VVQAEEMEHVEALRQLCTQHVPPTARRPEWLEWSVCVLGAGRLQ